MYSLLDQIKTEVFHSGFVDEVARHVHQDEAAVRVALHRWCAAILAALSRYTDHPLAMGRIFEGLISFPDVSAQVYAALIGEGAAAAPAIRRSEVLLEQLFAQRMPAVQAAVAQGSLVSPAASVQLRRIAGPIVLGLLSSRLRKGELSVSGLANALRSERRHLSAELDPMLAESLGIALPFVEEEALPPQTVGLRWASTLGWVVALAIGTMWMAKQCF